HVADRPGVVARRVGVDGGKEALVVVADRDATVVFDADVDDGVGEALTALERGDVPAGNAQGAFPQGFDETAHGLGKRREIDHLASEAVAVVTRSLHSSWVRVPSTAFASR